MGYYLYDGRGSVAGLTNEEGQIYKSYRYSVNGEITFGAPQYENEYTYNGESYNPNIESQYLRARYYNVVTATFLTEDSYLGEITNPLTLNRYNYTLSNYLNYQDPSGHNPIGDFFKKIGNAITSWWNNLWDKSESTTKIEAEPIPPTSVPETNKESEQGGNGNTFIDNAVQEAGDISDVEDCEVYLKWIPDVMQLNGTSEQEKYLLDRLTGINSKISDENAHLRWDQEKINKVWAESMKFYNKTGVEVDPRLLLAIIIQEGTGSFNTSSTNKAADGQNGINHSFDDDLSLAMDLLGGKIISYAYYEQEFSSARANAYERELPGIKDYNDILHYINWQTPRLHLINPNFDSGAYAGDNNWNRKVREIYGKVAFDGAAGQYTEYAKSLGKDKLTGLAEKYQITINSVTFEARQEGRDPFGKSNGEYVIIGVQE